MSAFLEKRLPTIFQIKTSTAIRLFEQMFHFPRSRDQIVHFGYLALREYLPAAERRDPFAKSVEEVPDLVHSEPSALGHVDDLQIVQDAGFVTALPANALRFRQQTNLLVIPKRRSLQASSACHFPNGHVGHFEKKKSLDLKRTSSPSVATNMKTLKTHRLSLIAKIAIALTFINTWVIFEETVVDRHGLWRYMPFYRVRLFCVWDAVVFAVTLMLLLASVLPLRSRDSQTLSATSRLPLIAKIAIAMTFLNTLVILFGWPGLLSRVCF
ncbi:MAG TPA: hypothetical protein VKE30_00835 [Chthoniobacterales bacterium]|nr:hypothetical protein [Chthoniobacterales bacterium]